MPLPAKIESLDSVEEPVRQFYVAAGEGDDAGFVLDLDVTEHPGARALKNALDAERRKARDANQQIKKYEGVDLDRWSQLSEIADDELEAFKSWREKRKASPTGDPKGQAGDGDEDFEERLNRIIAPMKDNYAKELDVRDKKIQEYETKLEQLNQEIVRNKIDQSFLTLATKYHAIDPSDVLLRAKELWRIDPEDGQPTAYDENGDHIRGKDGIAKLTQEEWMSSLASNKQYLFRESAGGGALGGSNRNGKFGRVKSKADLKTVEDKVAFIREHSREDFENLPTS